MPFVELSWASWDEFWPEGQELLKTEYDEYVELLGLWRQHEVDIELAKATMQAGLLYVAIARVNGAMTGYCMISIAPDLESRGNVIATQGPFWVKAQRRHKGLGLGAKLLGMCIERAKNLGANDLDLHHPIVGRGRSLAKFFQFIGAKPMNMSYRLKLKD